MEILFSAGYVLLYFIIMASVALLCRCLIRIPDEIFRKVLHCILLFSLLVFIFAFTAWWASALTAIAFEIVVYPILSFLERKKSYSSMTTERKKGELKASLLYVFTMFAVTIAICWGWLGDKYLVLASVYAWGFGDAGAALIGKRFGKHKFRLKYVDQHKSIEGSTAMFVLSLASVCIIMTIRGGLSIVPVIVISLATAFAATVAELYSSGGMDTVICPVSAMVVLLPLVYAFGGLS